MPRQPIEPGAKAPAFVLPDQRGTRRRLSEFRGRSVVLYFYPQDDTSACTLEAIEFTALKRAFSDLGAAILGVSPDDAASHCRFADKHNLNLVLLADVPGRDGVPKVCDRYGVWREKTLYGRRYTGLVRTTYVIDPKGRVIDRFDNVRARGHAQRVLDRLRAAAGG